MKKIKSSNSNKGIISIDDPLKKKHYKEKRKVNFLRLALTYLLPTVLMIVFFANEYYSMVKVSTEKRLLSIAESQAKILDIFMMERTRNLLNTDNINESMLERHLYELKTDSRAFIDVGYFELSKKTATMFLKVISSRYEKKPTIITSNKSFDQWGTIFQNDVVASAILDRLLHHSYTFIIQGKSYRMKDIIK